MGKYDNQEGEYPRKDDSQKNRFRPYLKTALIVLVFAGLTALIWTILNPFLQKAQKNQLEQVESSSAEASTFEPEASDGSGNAGRVKIPENMSVKFETPGWQCDENGWWYACDDLTCYINGWIEIQNKRYHINSRGYMDTGWTAIGGKGYFFEADGTCNENADNSKLLALTFDDGPCKYTNELLDTLKSHNVKATFFMLGTQLEEYGAQTVPRMVSQNCELGNHSYDHSYMSKMSTAECVEQFQKTDELIAGYSGGAESEVVRFPYGSFTSEQKQQVGKPNIYWDLDCTSLQSSDVSSYAANIEKKVTGGNIILMNEGSEVTPQVVDTLISDLTGNGYQFVTVEELAAAHGYKLENGVTYYGFSEDDIAAGRVTDQEE